MMELTGEKRTAMIDVLLVGAFLASLGQSLLNSSLPTLTEDISDQCCHGSVDDNILYLVLGVVTAVTACLVNRLATWKLLLGAMLLFIFGLYPLPVCLEFPYITGFPNHKSGR